MGRDTELLIDLVLNIGLPVALLLIGFFWGRAIEKDHLRRLDEQERLLEGIRFSNLRKLPAGMKAQDAALVQGECVIAFDYYKVFAGSLKNLFGGRIQSFETLLERARREATVRMLREARDRGANAVWNVRFETSTVGGKDDGKPTGVEAIVYGTAFRLG